MGRPREAETPPGGAGQGGFPEADEGFRGPRRPVVFYPARGARVAVSQCRCRVRQPRGRAWGPTELSEACALTELSEACALTRRVGAARGRGPALCSHSAEAINTAKRKPGWGLGGEIQSCVDDLASLCNECGVRKTGRLWLHAMGPARGHPGGSWELGWPGPATTTGHPHPADARVVMGSQPPRPATEAHTGPEGRRGLGRPPVLRAHPPPSDRPPKPSLGHAAFMPRTGREAWPWAEIRPVLEPRGSSARQHPQVHSGALPLHLRAWGHEGPT